MVAARAQPPHRWQVWGQHRRAAALGSHGGVMRVGRRWAGVVAIGRRGGEGSMIGERKKRIVGMGREIRDTDVISVIRVESIGCCGPGRGIVDAGVLGDWADDASARQNIGSGPLIWVANQ